MIYQKYYSSNIMTLTLVGDQSIDELKKLAKKHFAQLPNREVADPRITLPVFTQDLTWTVIDSITAER